MSNCDHLPIRTWATLRIHSGFLRFDGASMPLNPTPNTEKLYKATVTTLLRLHHRQASPSEAWMRLNGDKNRKMSGILEGKMEKSCEQCITMMARIEPARQALLSALSNANCRKQKGKHKESLSCSESQSLFRGILLLSVNAERRRERDKVAKVEKFPPKRDIIVEMRGNQCEGTRSKKGEMKSLHNWIDVQWQQQRTKAEATYIL